MVGARTDTVVFAGPGPIGCFTALRPEAIPVWFKQVRPIRSAFIKVIARRELSFMDAPFGVWLVFSSNDLVKRPSAGQQNFALLSTDVGNMGEVTLKNLISPASFVAFWWTSGK